MFKAAAHRYLVPFDGSFKQAKSNTTPDALDKKKHKKQLKRSIKQMRELQRMFYAHDRYSLLLVFQAMDAAGKDSTIRTVMSGINPAGCQVFSFKKPSAEELDHDFLWRTTKCLPERGRIGIFNRSYYEEVLVVKVHPEYLKYQKLPYPINSRKIWQDRYEAICAQEEHLARNGTVILKFWLNVSLEEQKNRFLDRIDDPLKNWKFSSGDIEERQHWKDYMKAYEDALNATSRPWAPWYAIPADDKPYMRMTVSDIIVNTMKRLKVSYPKISDAELVKFDEMRVLLEENK